MQPTAKISIIVPVYNVAPYLRQCLDSLVRQTYQNLEILCVNDGSTDESGDILQEYAAADERIKLIYQENAGLSAARNAGFQFSSGDYIMYVDSDDWIDLETCATAVVAAETYHADLVFWPYIREFDNSSQPKTLFQEDSIVFDAKSFFTQVYKTIIGLHDVFLKHPEHADTLVTAWGKLYKKELILENNAAFISTKEIGTEDALFNASVLKNVQCGVYLKKYFCHYRRNNASSLTSTYKPRLRSQWKRLFSYMYDTISDININQQGSLMQALNNRISLSIIGLGLNALALPRAEALAEVRAILSDADYRAAVKTLPLRYFPPHWWVFFACCKANFAPAVLCLLRWMERMRG